MRTSATAADPDAFGDFRFETLVSATRRVVYTTRLAAATFLRPPQVDPRGPGDGNGSSTARTTAGAISVVDEASASGVAARRAIALGTALGSRPQPQPQQPKPQHQQPPPEGATAGEAAARAGPGPEPMDPGPLAARIACEGP